jgi:hypothetical protein
MEATVRILARLTRWFTRPRREVERRLHQRREAEPERRRDVPYLPPAPEGARPQAGTMAVEPWRHSELSGFGF